MRNINLREILESLINKFKLSQQTSQYIQCKQCQYNLHKQLWTLTGPVHPEHLIA